MTAFHYYTATTLDGFIADDGHGLEWLLSQPIDEQGPGSYTTFIARIGAIAMGASTYRWILDNDEPWPYSLPTYVFTHRAFTPIADNVQRVEGAPAQHREQLVEAAGGKGVWIVGGGDLATQFAAAGMLDTVEVSIAPVMLGSGKPLFTGRVDLQLQELDRNEAFACARYTVR